MFKAIILCALYNLSDDQVEYQMRDRLSFVRFLGLALQDKVPHAKTVWLYREQLSQAGVMDALFEDFDGYLKTQGYQAMGGQIIDASIVVVPIQRNVRLLDPYRRQALQSWIAERRANPEEPLFMSAPGTGLSHDAIQCLVRKHADRASEQCPTLAKKRVTPHVLRRTAFMQFLE